MFGKRLKSTNLGLEFICTGNSGSGKKDTLSLSLLGKMISEDETLNFKDVSFVKDTEQGRLQRSQDEQNYPSGDAQTLHDVQAIHSLEVGSK